MAFYQQGEEMKRSCLEEEEERVGDEAAITAYWTLLAPITSFNYLGRILSAANDDWPEVVRNLWREWQKWAWLTRVLIREDTYDRTLGQIYLEVVLSVILYGSETWVTTPHIGRVLGGFHHRVAHRLKGKQPRQGRDSVWVYPLLEDAMEEAGLQEVKTYFSRLQNTFTQFISTMLIMEL